MKRILTLLLAAAFVACSPKNAPAEDVAPATPVAQAIDHAAYSSPDAAAQQRVCDYMKEIGVFYIATTDGDQPRVRPFGALHIHEGKLYIITGHKKRIAQQLAANPKVEICAQKDNAWVRVACTLVEDERVQTKKAYLDAFPHLRGQYNENDDNTAVYYMKDATATFSSFSSADEVVKF